MMHLMLKELEYFIGWKFYCCDVKRLRLSFLLTILDNFLNLKLINSEEKVTSDLACSR